MHNLRKMVRSLILFSLVLFSFNVFAADADVEEVVKAE